MNLDAMLESLRAMDGFAENVGMVLMHNGVVRGWSRQNHAPVSGVEVQPDHAVIEAIIRDIESRPGIFKVLVEAESGPRSLGDDLLRLVVAGDVREHVIPALSDLLDRVKAQGMKKREVPA